MQDRKKLSKHIISDTLRAKDADAVDDFYCDGYPIEDFWDIVERLDIRRRKREFSAAEDAYRNIKRLQTLAARYCNRHGNPKEKFKKHFVSRRKKQSNESVTAIPDYSTAMAAKMTKEHK